MESISIEAYRAMTKPKATNKSKAKEQARKLAQLVEMNLSELPGHKKEIIFHPVRKWRFDYSWPELKVALEVHGGIFTNGRHTRGKGFTEDKVKMNAAQLLGWIVIEATTAHVKNGQMLTWITEAIALRAKNAPN
jgi:hypothetical protein